MSTHENTATPALAKWTVAGWLALVTTLALTPMDAAQAESSLCAGFCGGPAKGCHCDSACLKYGDCCEDACLACGICETNTCEGACGAGRGSCYCDSACMELGDCCEDACTYCGAEVDCGRVRGAVCSGSEPDCQAYVAGNVPELLDRLSLHGQTLGFHSSNHPGFWCRRVCGKHWQGLVRMPTLGRLDGRFMIIDGSGRCRLRKSTFAVVHLGSREPGPAAYGSNRQIWGRNSWDVTPSRNDRIETWSNLFPGWDHPGGMQAIGRYVVVPLEGSCCDGPAAVAVVDMSDPLEPGVVQLIPQESTQASAAAIAKLEHGRFLLIVGQHDTKSLHVYLSNDPDAPLDEAEFDLVADWDHEDHPWGYYQSIQLITDQSGELYLLGMGPPHSNSDWDRIDAHRVRLHEDGRFDLEFLARKTLWCSTPGDRQCHFLAGSSIYVDDEHRLILYASEHDTDGPDRSVKMKEFRSIPVDGHCTSDAEGWIELHEGIDFEGRSLLGNRHNRHLIDWSNLARAEGFDERASSLRYCLPEGRRLIVCKHADCIGPHRTFSGTGRTQSLASLHGMYFPDGSALGNSISALSWGL